MPNQRAKDKVLLNISMSQTAISEMDRALRLLGETNRSDFIREAIRERIMAHGISIPKELFAAPPRFGRKPHANRKRP